MCLWVGGWVGGGSYYVGGNHIVTQVDKTLVGFSLTNFLSYFLTYFLFYFFIHVYYSLPCFTTGWTLLMYNWLSLKKRALAECLTSINK